MKICFYIVLFSSFHSIFIQIANFTKFLKTFDQFRKPLYTFTLASIISELALYVQMSGYLLQNRFSQFYHRPPIEFKHSV